MEETHELYEIEKNVSRVFSMARKWNATQGIAGILSDKTWEMIAVDCANSQELGTLAYLFPAKVQEILQLIRGQ